MDWPAYIHHGLSDAARSDQLARLPSDRITPCTGRPRTCQGCSDRPVFAGRWSCGRCNGSQAPDADLAVGDAGLRRYSVYDDCARSRKPLVDLSAHRNFIRRGSVRQPGPASNAAIACPYRRLSRSGKPWSHRVQLGDDSRPFDLRFAAPQLRTRANLRHQRGLLYSSDDRASVDERDRKPSGRSGKTGHQSRRVERGTAICLAHPYYRPDDDA